MLQKLRNYLFAVTLDNDVYLITRYDYAGYNELSLYVIYLLDKTTDSFRAVGQIETRHELEFDTRPYAHSPIVIIAYGIAYGLITLTGTRQRLQTAQLKALYKEYRSAIETAKIDIGYTFA